MPQNDLRAKKNFYASKKASFHDKVLRHALRCNIARHLTGESYRSFSLRITDSTLFQWFTSISAFGFRKAVSKSSLERYEKYFNDARVKDIIKKGLSTLSDSNTALTLGFKEGIDFSNTFTDSTCLKAHIHFPVDWVLLRDAARSVLSAIKTIRRQKLKHRMVEPALLLKQMNTLCIKMTHTRRKKESKKQRKAILRDMKKVSQCIAKHGQRYRALLDKQWHETAWSEAQKVHVIRRIDRILDQLPTAIKQAHDRIIGERKIVSSAKLLSVYDNDVHVIIRGKAGNEVEFGQKLLLSEQANGIIIDWALCSGQTPSDAKLLIPALERIKKSFGPIKLSSTDRGFSSKETREYLAKHEIYNAVCPRNPKQLQEKLTELHFLDLQKRRSQTEARIGIFKNVFLGQPLRSRITQNKRHAINCCVLTNNLWVLARMALSDEHVLLKKAA